jgi:hypothetical protein
MRITRTCREEMETTITFNRHLGAAECCTADPAIARRWKRVGWPVAVLDAYPDGKPRTWQTNVPWRLAVALRRRTGMPRKCEEPAPGSQLAQG